MHRVAGRHRFARHRFAGRRRVARHRFACSHRLAHHHRLTRQPSRVTFDDKSEILIRAEVYDLFALITGFRSALHCRAGIPDAIFDMFIRSAWICL